MAPRPADPNVRLALIEAAARLVLEHGPDALTTRAVAAEVGTSTMAVYTYFTGMDDLRAEVAKEGFARLAAFLDGVPPTDDPVEALAALGAAYYLNSKTNPHLYGFMFGERSEKETDIGHETFERIVSAVRLAIEAGRFRDDDPEQMARELWVSSHGIVTLQRAGVLTLEEAFATSASMGAHLFVGFGDDPELAKASIERAIQRVLGDDPLAVAAQLIGG